jgi:NitT/TauT family transport system substrate-binding protein
MLNRSRRWPAVLGIIALVCAAAPAAAQSDDGGVIRVGEVNTDLYAEGYYALEAGMFKAAGLNVQVTTFATGGASATALAGNAVDVAITNPIALANAITHDVPWVIVALGGVYSSKAPSTALCVGSKSALRVPADFAGKTVAVSSLGNLEQIGFQQWLATNGVDPSAVRFVELKSTQMAPALERGTIDAAMITDPALSFAVKNGTRVFAPAFDAIAKQFPISVWVASTGWAAQHPDLARRFAQVIYQAGRWANAHHEQTAPILAKYAGVDPGAMGGMPRALYAESSDAPALQKELDLAYRFKLISQPVSAAKLQLP